MSYAAKCSHSFAGKQCPLCGAVLTPAEVNEALKKYSWLILAGLLGTLLATFRFPLLDLGPVMLICLLIFFVPILAHIMLALAKRTSSKMEVLRRTYKWAGALLLAIAAVLFLNGALDTANPTKVLSFVVRKAVSHGRGGPSYHLTVSPSWRPGREDEQLRVSRATFVSASRGESVAIEIHPGKFGLPWFGRVTPQ